MKPENFRLKFTQHQRRSGALWKELVFELRNYFEGWIDGLNIKDFKSLKDLMIVDQLKRRVPSDVKDHLLDEWGELVDPLELAGKLDQYESARSNRKLNPVRMADRRPIDRIKPNSPKKENHSKFVEKAEHQFGKNSAPKANWRSEKFERRTVPAGYYCHSKQHLRPNCPQLNKQKELVNRVETSDQAEALFAPYLRKALVNNVKMSISRDTGASIDILSRNHIRPEDFTGETVWVKQPLDLNFTCLPLAKVEIQSPEFGHIVIKAAVIDARLDSGWYLLSNKTHQLILEAKQKPNVNAVRTRSQTRKTDLPPIREREKIVNAEEPAAIIRGELTALNLPPAEREDRELVEISSRELKKAQRECTALQACVLQAEKGNCDYQITGEPFSGSLKITLGTSVYKW
ncbi:hypothetical protein AVEN_13854-1 [Araneus ventricosus]|uniref:Uncharacterized protein n=1 Tax=Araneus ventricosus TaxID=182803 RepID=A0A4Y2THU2_ARAVE|nr:hypothetical protein AVEN_13854-1 [Araneus ventricosus]